jgi:hypothetical protein
MDLRSTAQPVMVVALETPAEPAFTQALQMEAMERAACYSLFVLGLFLDQGP